MGWGYEPHEGWADEKLPDGRWLGPTRRSGDPDPVAYQAVCGWWLGPTRRSGDPDPVAYQAVCGCGWRSEREHQVPPRPADLPRDERGVPYGPAYDAWIAAREAADTACWEDWNAEHFEPLLGYEPHTQLILGRSDGGARHFLDGRPVHAGSTLEMLLADGTWLPVRYEWDWQPDSPPTAHAALGLPKPAERLVDRPLVSFELPARAILRWPQERP